MPFDDARFAHLRKAPLIPLRRRGFEPLERRNAPGVAVGALLAHLLLPDPADAVDTYSPPSASDNDFAEVLARWRCDQETQQTATTAPAAAVEPAANATHARPSADTLPAVTARAALDSAIWNIEHAERPFDAPTAIVASASTAAGPTVAAGQTGLALANFGYLGEAALAALGSSALRTVAAESTPAGFALAQQVIGDNATSEAAPSEPAPGEPAPSKPLPADTVDDVPQPAGTTATDTQVSTTGLNLTDAAGQAVDVTLDDNTVLVGAATWCSACAQFKAQLAAPGVADTLDGLQLVFAFGDEGGSGPGGVVNPAYLEGLPGEVVFLAEGSVRPDRFPTAFNPATGQFDTHAADAVLAWLSRGDETQSTVTAPADNDSEPDCGCGHKASAGATAALGESAVTSDSAATQGSTAVLTGDANGDGQVNGLDYLIWAGTYGKTDPPDVLNGAADGDFNLDHTVDGLDYLAWAGNYGAVQAPGAFSIIGPLSPSASDDVIVAWDASAGATSYDVIVSQNADLSAPLFAATVSGTIQPLFDIGEGTFYAGVTAQNADGSTPADNQPFEFEIVFDDLRQTILVTSIDYAIDFAPIIPPAPQYFYSDLGADYQCTIQAPASGILEGPWDGASIEFRALVTENPLSLGERSSLGNFGYVNVLGQDVAATEEQLLSGDLTAPILDQNGQLVEGSVPVWTGATADGSWSGFTCDEWTNPFAAAATVGNLNGTGSERISNGTRSCSLGARLLCVSVL
ncbi:MAG: hypothetical protein R3C10_18930 [Pirellulales bacterium]